MALLTQIDVSSLFLHDCTINAKGTRSCAISFKDTSPVQVKLCEQPLRTPFGFSSYDENANRKNLDLSISDASLAGAIREIGVQGDARPRLSTLLEEAEAFLNCEV